MTGPKLDPLALPTEELGRLKREGYGHLIAPKCSMCNDDGKPCSWCGGTSNSQERPE